MSRLRSTICTIVMLLAALRAIWLVWITLAVSSAPDPGPDHAGQDAFSRFEPLRPHLPAEGTIGFVAPSAQHGQRQRDIAQYVLAPLVVDTGDGHLVVVADFSDDSQLQLFLADGRYQLAARVAAGLAVVERAGP